MKVSPHAPLSTTSVDTVTPVVYLYTPGVKVRPPISPEAPRLVLAEVVARPWASLYAVSLLFTAVLRFAGVGLP